MQKDHANQVKHGAMPRGARKSSDDTPSRQCRDCQKVFARLTEYKYYLSYTIASLPTSCTTCIDIPSPSSFSLLKAYELTTSSRHRKQHERSYKCPKGCKASFAFLRVLERHDLNAHPTTSGTKLFCQQPGCHKLCNSKDSLLRRTAH